MEHYPFATGDLLCRPHARLAQSEPKVKGKMNGKPPLTFSSAGAILQIWQQRNAPLPSSHILFCFTSCFGVYTKLGTHPSPAPMLDFSARASPSLRNPTSFCYKSLLFGELLQVAIAICEIYILYFFFICARLSSASSTFPCFTCFSAAANSE